jgi:FAD/FMN-containing dehydrogenase
MTSVPTAQSLLSFASAVSGSVWARGDAGLAEEVACFNTAVVHDPDVVVAAENAGDVALAIGYAREHGLPVHVQATGHGAFAPVTRGVLVSTRRMAAVSVDPAAREARIGAGARWGSVILAAAEHGLAPITGSSPSVGAVGYTLGGGLGPLARTFGFTADYATEFTVVTADARVVRAAADEHPDLFAALRGGKGGLGVVVEMRLRLVELAGFYGGGLFYDADAIEPALRTWADWVATVPETVNSSVALLRIPDIEEAPAPLRGHTVLHLRYAFVGTPEDGELLLAPMRDAAPVFLDLVREMPAADVGLVHADPDSPGPGWDRGLMLSGIDQDFVSGLLEVLGPETEAPFIAAEIRHLGGATARRPEGLDSVGGRDAAFTFVLIGVPVPELFAEVLPRAADAVVARIAPWRSAATNVNLAGHITTAQEFASAWPEDAFQRLAGTRTTYDPGRVFSYGPS